jgi:hypothetical protein
VGEALARWLADGPSGGAIDPDALATLGIDFDAVREQLEQTFGPDALEQTHTACLGIAPRLKLASPLRSTTPQEGRSRTSRCSSEC